MGVGSPENLVEAVYRGVDMFDCVLPTRLARHGTFWDETGRHSITHTKFKYDDREFMSGFSYAYLRHLFIEEETLGKRILSLWNLKFLHDLTDRMKDAIREDRFEEFRKEFYSRFNVR